jgi:hypothetical protein
VKRPIAEMTVTTDSFPMSSRALIASLSEWPAAAFHAALSQRLIICQLVSSTARCIWALMLTR